MEAQQALAFVARREAASSMPASRWRHVLSLELGWMAPGQAAAYVAACQRAGLLEAAGDDLRLTFDAKAVDVPRRFRPDPQRLPEAPAPVEGFPGWLARVAGARGEDAAATMEAVEAMQQKCGGLLHAEAALLLLGLEAGLDVREAAAAALRQLA